jgi:hypothetical protein
MGTMKQLPRKIEDWPPLERELYEERAGVRQFCGNQSRETAEREAEIEIRKLAWRENT